MKTESQLAIFKFCLYSLSQVFNDINDKRSNGYVLYLYTKVKYKSVTIYTNNKTGGGD